MSEQTWQQYKDAEMRKAIPLLKQAGFVLDKVQVHILGERSLVATKKLVLLGTAVDDGTRVVMKVSSDLGGKKEIKREHDTGQKLSALPFAYHTFYFPKELYYEEQDGMLCMVTEYISQEKPFLAYSDTEQFFASLRALIAQEGAHATAYSHVREIKSIFGIQHVRDYLHDITAYGEVITNNCPDKQKTTQLLNDVKNELQKDTKLLEQYGDFLTHDDFAPHNVRISDGNMYLLDHTSLIFGNKYESWARWINYMVLYNPTLEKYLVQFVHDNRDSAESHVLRLMRMYKVGTLLAYYADSSKRAEGNTKKLALARIDFWTDVLNMLMHGNKIDYTRVDEYKKLRDSLRSEDELQRQRELGQLE